LSTRGENFAGDPAAVVARAAAIAGTSRSVRFFTEPPLQSTTKLESEDEWTMTAFHQLFMER
jgi:hypothetical protein